MRVIRTTDTTENLCDSCSKRGAIPMCDETVIEWGNGLGNDNVIACDQCTSPYSKTIYPGEIAPKK